LRGSVAVNSVCPGWVKTDMGGPGANREVAEGADTAVWLALDAPQKLTGKFIRDRASPSRAHFGLRTLNGNSVRRVGSSFPPQRHSPTGLPPGLAPDIARSFFGRFDARSAGFGPHSVPTALGGQEMSPQVWVGVCS